MQDLSYYPLAKMDGLWGLVGIDANDPTEFTYIDEGAGDWHLTPMVQM